MCGHLGAACTPKPKWLVICAVTGSGCNGRTATKLVSAMWKRTRRLEPEACPVDLSDDALVYAMPQALRNISQSTLNSFAISGMIYSCGTVSSYMPGNVAWIVRY
jgi:hypothetical protein